ncbi:MAG: hypothetical protein ABI443_05375 [Chthoniobacterales bacterium]
MNKLLPILCCLFLPVLCHAQDADTKLASQVAVSFYDGYLLVAKGKHADPAKYVYDSRLVTAAFQNAYRKFRVNPDNDSDPILNAQDTPKKGYHVQKVQINGIGGFIILQNDNHEFPTLTLEMLKTNYGWQINGIDDLLGR